MSDRRTLGPWRRRLGVLLTFALSLCLVIIVARTVVSQTDIVPTLVDTVRNLPFVGPDRMATVEDYYYNLQDSWNLFVYEHTHAPVVTAQTIAKEFNATPDTARIEIPTPEGPTATPLPTLPGPTATPTPIIPSAPRPIAPIILSDSQAGEGVWTTDELPLYYQSRPPLRRTFFRPDPERPYARVDIVWMDTSRTQLSVVAGTAEPRSTTNNHGSGQIPLVVQKSGNLLAAWNGGFLTIHGAYGMMVDRQVIAPAKEGFAVLAQYEDGSMHIGVWGRDIKMTPDLVTFRQNGPILIDQGKLNQEELLAWGRSISGETRIWRSGIGITKDGALLYAAGNGLSAQTLGETLVHAGAVEAMQLDVNAWHVFYFTYELTEQGLIPTRLSNAMSGNTKIYLSPYDRDFMYLTLRDHQVGLPPGQVAPHAIESVTPGGPASNPEVLPPPTSTIRPAKRATATPTPTVEFTP